MFDGLPSESVRRRRVLYLAEGLVIGGGGTYLLILVGGLIGTLTESAVSIGPVLFLLVFLLLAVRFEWAARLDREAGFGRAKSPVEADWTATRRWGWVALTSVLIGGLLAGVSVFVWGWEEVVYSNRGLDVFALAILLGLGLWVYGLYDRSDRDRQEPRSER